MAKWIAVGAGLPNFPDYLTTPYAVYTCNDGASWGGLTTVMDSDGQGEQANCVAVGNSIIVIGGVCTTTHGMARIIRSTNNGSSFSSSGITSPWGTTNSGAGVYGVAYNGTKWMAVGGQAPTQSPNTAVSSDTLTWTDPRSIALDTVLPSSPFRVRYINSYWWVGGLAGSGGYPMLVRSNDDGATWSTITMPAGWILTTSAAGAVRDIAYDGSGVYVAVGYGRGDNVGTSPSIARSTNGTSWTTQTSPFSRKCYGVIWIAGLSLFIAAGDNGVATSPDGSTWTLQSPVMLGGAVAFGDSLAVAVNRAGNVGNPSSSKTTDGSSWTDGTDLLSNLYDIAFNNVPTAVSDADTGAGTDTATDRVYTLSDPSTGVEGVVNQTFVGIRDNATSTEIAFSQDGYVTADNSPVGTEGTEIIGLTDTQTGTSVEAARLVANADRSPGEISLKPQFRIKQYDRLPAIVATLLDSRGKRVNLTGATVKFHLAHGSESAIVNASAIILNAADALVAYEWGPSDTATAGTYNAEFEVTYETGEVETFPNNRYIKVVIRPQLA